MKTAKLRMPQPPKTLNRNMAALCSLRRSRRRIPQNKQSAKEASDKEGMPGKARNFEGKSKKGKRNTRHM